MKIIEFFEGALASGWPGWIVAGGLAISWVTREILNARSERSATTNSDTSTLKMQLEMLNASAGARLREMQAIQEALNLDPVPDPASLADLPSEGNPIGTYVFQYVTSRSEARRRLPSAIRQLMAVQARRAQLESELALGVETPSSEISDLRSMLEHVSADQNSIIAMLVGSPRIFVQPEPPEDANDGDLWIQ